MIEESREIREMINLIERKIVVLNRNDVLSEMARINKNQTGAVPYPFNKFNIAVNSNDHEPPHIHVYCDGWNIRFLIEDGKLLSVAQEGKGYDVLHYTEKNIPIWLGMKSNIMKGHTNQEYAMYEWNHRFDEHGRKPIF